MRLAKLKWISYLIKEAPRYSTVIISSTWNADSGSCSGLSEDIAPEFKRKALGDYGFQRPTVGAWRHARDTSGHVMLIGEAARLRNLSQRTTGIAHQGLRSLYSAVKQESIGRLPRTFVGTPNEVRCAQSSLARQRRRTMVNRLRRVIRHTRCSAA